MTINIKVDIMLIDFLSLIGLVKIPFRKYENEWEINRRNYERYQN